MCLRSISASLAMIAVAAATPARAGIAESDAEELIERAIAIYSGEIEATHGLPVSLVYQWNSRIFQAQGGRVEGEVKLIFYGGLLDGEMDLDSLAVVVCHELGHVLGGYPETRPYPFPKNSVEGQADYFATAKCLRRLFADDANASIVSGMRIPPAVRQSCDDAHDDPSERALCRRVLVAGLRSFQLMYEDPSMSYDEPETQVVARTVMTYPSAQCRLDTMMAGALCTVAATEPFSFESVEAGVCRRDVPHESAGARPRCWFAE